MTPTLIETWTSHSRFALPGALLVLLFPAGGCLKPKPAAPPEGERVLPPIEILKDGRWLFTYVEPDGAFATTDKPAAVPENARRVVRIIDPSKGVLDRKDTADVYVVDVQELLHRGKVTARVMAREVFETRAQAQLPPGESSPLPAAPPATAPSQGQERAADGGGLPAAPEGSAVVTLYGTSWCGACAAARRYLASRKIPFTDKDIERDPAAARELAEKAARLGVPADRVPVLDVRGRLLVGFDRARLEALLGDAT